MITVADNEHSYEFRGLSSDKKPIGSNCVNKNVEYVISNGSVFLEMDTSKVFMLVLTKVNNDKKAPYKGEWIELK